jgi:hypothetical protein
MHKRNEARHLRRLERHHVFDAAHGAIFGDRLLDQIDTERDGGGVHSSARRMIGKTDPRTSASVQRSPAD